jgi:acetyl-CoA carboxylase biotin carboxyl carrier protein
MIDLKFLEKLLELLNSTSAGAIEVKKNLWSTTIRVSKDTHLSNSGPVTYQVAAPAAAVPPPADNPSAVAPPASAAPPAEAHGEPEAPSPVNLQEIKSPMVGTFYAQPEPGAEPYVRVGSRIRVGQPLCIIEAMKIMNPIDAEITGVIKEVCVQDTQPVEFGHVLFRVDPNG